MPESGGDCTFAGHDSVRQQRGVRGEYFKDIRPVDTVVEVNGFINKEWLLEIEADAVVDER